MQIHLNMRLFAKLTILCRELVSSINYTKNLI